MANKFLNFVSNLSTSKHNPFTNMFTGVTNWLKGFTGSGMTNAQIEQTNMLTDFQERMRDTQYQSAVNDMKNAGVNPALMYGSGASGNSAPSGGMSSLQPSLDPVGLIGAIANLSLIDAQRKNIEADTASKNQGVEESKVRIDNMRQQTNLVLKNIDLMDRNIRSAELDNEAKDIANSYLIREKEMSLAISDMTLQELESQIKLNNKTWESLDADVKLKIQSLANKEQELRNLLAQESLTKAQVGQVSELTKNIKKERDILIKDEHIKEKELNWFTHDKIVGDVKAAGSIVGNVLGIGKIGSIAKSVLSKKSAPIDLAGYGAYGTYD